MGDDSDEQLEQRVDQLEQQLSKMLPGRRGVLKGLGAAALGGAAVGGATGGAAGQSAAGQIGTSSSPVDVEAANVNAGSVSTESLRDVADIIIKDGDDIQSRFEEVSQGDTVVMPRSEQVLSDTIVVSTKDVTILGARTTQADGANIEQWRLTSDNIEFKHFECDGNRANNSTDAANRADNILVTGGCQGVTVSHGYTNNSTRHGIRVTGEGGNVFEATVEDVIGNTNERDTVSIEGRGTNRNPTARDIYGNFSNDRGTLEVADGVENATVENVYGRGQWYVVDVQDHGTYPNHSTTIEHVRGNDVTFTVASFVTGNVQHKGTEIIDAKGDGKIQVIDTDNPTIRDCEVIDTDTGDSAFEIFNCNSPTVVGNKLRFEDTTPSSAVNGIYLGLKRDIDVDGAQIHHNDMTQAANAQIRIRNTSSSGSLTHYDVSHNFAFIQNDVGDADSIVEKNRYL